MTAEQPGFDRVVRTQVDRLIEAHQDEHSPEEIERLAHESVADLEDAPIQTYVPNLVYNDVKNKLVEGRTPE